MSPKKKNRTGKKENKKHIRKAKAPFPHKRIAVVLLSLLISVGIVYSVNYFNLLNQEKNQKEEQNQKASTNDLMDKMKKMLDEEKQRLEVPPKIDTQKSDTEKLPPVLRSQNKYLPSSSKVKKVEEENHLSEIKDYKKSLEKKYPEGEPTQRSKEKKSFFGKPRLAIVIDDVAFAHQTKLIHKIPFRVTPSFFPPTQDHPSTVNLSKEFSFSMVHLPLEALSHASPEKDTFLVGQTKNQMHQRIRELKTLFPHIDYYNNHTGSKFTADYISMKKLIEIMQEEGLTFMDSRTTAQTKVPKVTKEKGLSLLSRDIFLDNSPDEDAIKTQLKKAVGVAKRHGYAIAIGHPHVNTLNVLIKAEPLLKDVELVYLKDLE